MKNPFINKNSKVFIATFSHYEKGKRLPTNGFIEPLLSFFLAKVNNILLIDQPHPVSDSIEPIVEIYKQKKIFRKFYISRLLFFPIFLLCKIPSKKKTRIAYKLRDFITVMLTQFIVGGHHDLFIGIESINTIAGLFLKKLGYINTVVYYVSDYSPIRFENILMNRIYIWLDQYCVKHADYTWDVSLSIKKGRLKAGLSKKYLKKIIYVPNGLFKEQIHAIPIAKRNPNRLVYMGILDPEKGIDLILNAFRIIKINYPKTELHIIGGTEEGIKRVKNISIKLHIDKSLIFYGFVPPGKQMLKILNNCYIGLAAYQQLKNMENNFGDSGKIRHYLGAGLPIVATTIQHYTKYAIKCGAGVAADDTVEGYSGSISKLLKDKLLYRQSSIAAIKLARKNTWENSYGNAFKYMMS